MRRIDDPFGDRWTVDVEWTSRYLGSRIERRLRRRSRRDIRKRDWSSVFDGLDFLGGIGELGTAGIVVAIAILAVGATWAFGPVLLVLALDLIELLLFPMIAAGVIAWRLRRRHAFSIVAIRQGHRIAQWCVVGVRETRRIEKAIAEAIRSGGDADTLSSEYRAPSPPPVDGAR